MMRSIALSIFYITFVTIITLNLRLPVKVDEDFLFMTLPQPLNKYSKLLGILHIDYYLCLAINWKV